MDAPGTKFPLYVKGDPKNVLQSALKRVIHPSILLEYLEVKNFLGEFKEKVALRIKRKRVQIECYAPLLVKNS